jgi:hypothetical protein
MSKLSAAAHPAVWWTGTVLTAVAIYVFSVPPLESMWWFHSSKTSADPFRPRPPWLHVYSSPCYKIVEACPPLARAIRPYQEWCDEVLDPNRGRIGPVRP